MLAAVALVACAYLHQPVPDDVYRFGYSAWPGPGPWHPALTARRCDAWEYRQRVSESQSSYHFYGREHLHAERAAHAAWLYHCWDALEWMSGGNDELRLAHAKKLQSLIGEVPYFLGVMPAVPATD